MPRRPAPSMTALSQPSRKRQLTLEQSSARRRSRSRRSMRVTVPRPFYGVYAKSSTTKLTRSLQSVVGLQVWGAPTYPNVTGNFLTPHINLNPYIVGANIVSQGYFYGFNFNNFPHATDLKAVFRRYRILSVKAIFTPSVDICQSGTGDRAPTPFTSVIYDDATDFTDTTQPYFLPNLKWHKPLSTFSRRLTPLLMGSADSNPGARTLPGGTWIDLHGGHGDEVHYGLLAGWQHHLLAFQTYGGCRDLSYNIRFEATVELSGTT